MFEFQPMYDRELTVSGGKRPRRLDVRARTDLAADAANAAGVAGPASPALDAAGIVRAFVAAVEAGCFSARTDPCPARFDVLERHEREGKRHERFSLDLPELEARALGCLVRMADATAFWERGLEAFVVRELGAEGVAPTDPAALWRVRQRVPELPFAVEIPEAVELEERTVLVRLAATVTAAECVDRARDLAERWSTLAGAGAFGGVMLPFSSAALTSVSAPYDDEIALRFAHLDCTRDGWIAFISGFTRFHDEVAPVAAIELG